jgi:hypothetical protein
MVWGDWSNTDRNAATFYQFEKPKRRATISGSIDLSFSKGYMGQFWIQAGTMIVPSYSFNNFGGVGFFNYPAGGKPFAKLLGFKRPISVTYSAAAQNLLPAAQL